MATKNNKNVVEFTNIFTDVKIKMNANEFEKLVDEQRKHLIVKRGFNCFVGYIGCEKNWLAQLEIPFEDIHPYREDVSADMKNESVATQLLFVKVLYANKLSWLMAEAKNDKFAAVFSKISSDMKEEILTDKKLTDKQKSLFYNLID